MDLGLGEIITIAAAAILLIPLAAGAVLVVLIVSNRADADPSGRRPAVVYSYGVSFLTLFAALFASFVVVAELASLIGSHPGQCGTSTLESGLSSLSIEPGQIVCAAPKHQFGDSVARGVVIALLVLVVAGYLHRRHAAAGNRVTAGLAFAEPSGRVRSSYVAAVSFVCTVIALVAVVVATYQIFRLIAPGVFNPSGSGRRVVVLRTLLPFTYLSIVAMSLVRRHVSQLPPDSRPWWSGPPRPFAPPPAGGSTDDGESVTVLVNEVEVLDATAPVVARPPRKPAPRKQTPRKQTPRKQTPRKQTPRKQTPKD